MRIASVETIREKANQTGRGPGEGGEEDCLLCLKQHKKNTPKKIKAKGNKQKVHSTQSAEGHSA